MRKFHSIFTLINLFVSTYFFLLIVGTAVLFTLWHISTQIQALTETTNVLSPQIQSLFPSPRPTSSLAFLINDFAPLPSPHVTPSPQPTPVATPFPPKDWLCATVPILMYHHVQPREIAVAKGQTALSVFPQDLDAHLTTITQKGYTVITLTDLRNFFRGTQTLPSKPLILTFDDGYEDFHTYALPLLVKHQMKANLFVPTGLIENPDYLSWNQIKEISQAGISIDHHSWSHANLARPDRSTFMQEIDVASAQLSEHGYSPTDILAYPYGGHNQIIETYLQEKGFSIAVTTKPGTLQCREERLKLKRTRIGNGALANYGI